MDIVPIERVPGLRRACLREISGREEFSADRADTAMAIRLLDSLLAPQMDTDLRPGRAERLTVGERDLLLSVVYERTYGRHLESTVRCPGCESRFDLEFDVADLVRELRARSDTGAVAETGDEFFLSNGCRFRLLTGADELAVLGMNPEGAKRRLLSNCIVEGDADAHGATVQEALDRIEPVIDLDLSARCPECGVEHAVHFNLQSYLLTALMQERDRLAREVHCLARAYGWTLDEILSLPRSQRRVLVELVGREDEESR